MKQTYDEAISRVFSDEGGYSNVPGDTGGPTNYGITIADARRYWKSNATASDMRTMPKSVAEDIYRQHYATSINYDNLPPGVDYSVLDYAINSGTNRALKVYNGIKNTDPIATINNLYDERVKFLTAIAQQPSKAKFLKGWLARCTRGRTLALNLNKKYSNTSHKTVAAGGVIVAGAGAATQAPHAWPWIIGITAVVAIAVYLYIHFTKGK